MNPETSTPPTPAPEAPRPYVAASEVLPEFTLRAVLVGVVLGVVFGAANAYLGLVSGLTISTSIPIAVMTVAVFHALRRKGTAAPAILEANLSQTIGSASSSVASGVIFTLPALFLWHLDPSLLQMTALALCGGALGVLFMIPLRPYLMQREHHNLPYPEGTACAEVLKAAETGGAQARGVFLGLGAGALFRGLCNVLQLFPGTLKLKVPVLPKAEIGMKLEAALFGVGFILGPRIATVMVAGGLLSSLVIIPALSVWGADRTTPLFPEEARLLRDMSSGELWDRYVRYVGAGAVAAAGLITLIKSIPTMLASFRLGTAQIRQRLRGGEVPEVERTQRDLSLGLVAGGALVVAIFLAAVPHVFGALDLPAARIAAAFLVVLCSFFFVTVSARIVGIVGVTSNPTSGMTIASLLATASVFLLFGWTGDAGKAGALTVGCVVAIAASIAGDTSQDLKTGFLLGATPRRQQWGELLGVLSSAAAVCYTVILLHRTHGFGSQELPAPQATLMKLVIEGVLEQALPWALIGLGVALAVAAELLRLPALAFAVGIYLPVSTMVPVFLGGMLRLILQRRARNEQEAAATTSRGVLFGSGLVGGSGLMGVLAAILAYRGEGDSPVAVGTTWAGGLADVVALAAFALLVLAFVRACRKPG